MAKFDLASVFAAVQNQQEQDVSKLDTKEQLEYIDIDLIDPDPKNFYELSGLDALAANIELLGLQQPLRVRSGEDGHVIIVSGHRRCAALRELVSSGREDLRAVPCIREHAAALPALQELRLICANSDTRRLTSAELGQQAARVESLLYQLQEAGYDFPGRMRDHVAEACRVSKSKLARLKVIRERLDKAWSDAYNKAQLTESAAYELARLPAAHQQAIRQALKAEKQKTTHLAESDVRRWGEKFAGIDKCSCKRHGWATCSNRAAKYEHVLTQCSCTYVSCAGCCADCSSLTHCRHACQTLAAHIKALRADERAERQQRQAEQEAKDAPDIEMIRKLWQRFGEARAASGQSLQDCYAAARRSYCASAEKEAHEMELGTAKITLNTTLPYSAYCPLNTAKALIGLADLLGCSLDYLLCRTDCPTYPPTADKGDADDT